MEWQLREETETVLTMGNQKLSVWTLHEKNILADSHTSKWEST